MVDSHSRRMKLVCHLGLLNLCSGLIFGTHHIGDHSICIHSNITGGWINTEHIKLYLDVNVGSSKHDLEYVTPH
jgi:hypothetical protein